MLATATQIKCPHCGWVHGEALDAVSGRIRIRCGNKRCRRWFVVNLGSLHLIVHTH